MKPPVGMVAVIQFPGSNCEYETMNVIRKTGLGCGIFRWNQLEELGDADPDAFVIPGGFSFQDRVRAGAVAAKERVMDLVFRAAVDGKPVLGICNGAQILVESGLVPGRDPGRIEAALAANHVPGRSGYLSSWIFVKAGPGAGKAGPWLSALGDDPIPLPIAHAEGRFVFSDDGEADEVGALVYCDHRGRVNGEYPENPNGSQGNLAAVAGMGGNVLAMMPHPERAFGIRHLPPWIPGKWGDERKRAWSGNRLEDTPGPGALFFESLLRYLERGE